MKKFLNKFGIKIILIIVGIIVISNVVDLFLANYKLKNNKILSVPTFYMIDSNDERIDLDLARYKIMNEYDNKENVGKFYGTYYGQIASKVEGDEMYILTNDTINDAVVYNYETNETLGVYNKKETNDKYDIYLSGATPIIGIKNTKVQNGKELLIFRDSFGSSLAPLLIDDYENIILIDLRYISNIILDKFVEFKDNQDVLFIYSTMLLNQNILK